MLENSENKKSLFDYISFLCACVCALPICVFLFEALKHSPQLRDAFIILTVILIALALKYNLRPRRPSVSRRSISLLIASYAAFIFAFFIIKQNFDFFTAFIPPWSVYLIFMFAVFAAGSFFIAAVGTLFFDSRRYVYAIAGGFFSLSILSLIFQFADLPLRILAGKCAGIILSLFGENVKLIAYSGEIPQIALQINSQSFLVATECNGFGIISSCLITAVIIAIFKRGKSLARRVAILPASLLIGFAANTLRIVSIIGVSLFIGQEHYYFYHELIGYIFFAGGILLTLML